ncbi:MAG TPA: polyprenyl diphosphate synthase [Actinomycetota bacterium]|nr:polyprenyl diphosphate synthase [Actinomycetota bacterium]
MGTRTSLMPRARTSGPEHVAIVMDGNGRWATSRGLPRTEGHRRGEEAVARAVRAALDADVKFLTLYAFSTENWRRPKPEVRFLMNDTIRLVADLRDEFHARGVRMRWIGRRDWRVPKKILNLIDETIALTGRNKTMTLTIAFNYGGRAEIVDAARALGEQVAAKEIKAGDIDERALRAALYDPELPDVDLFIRTGGEQRISNYLLWQSSYAELVFQEVLWPDFAAEHFDAAVREFRSRKRRFGKV